MIRSRKLDIATCIASLLMALVIATNTSTPMAEYLTRSMPAVWWALTGLGTGLAQLYLLQHPDKRNTALHWNVAFFTCGFWTYVAAAGMSTPDYGILPTVCLTVAAVASGWNLINVRYR